MNEVTERLLKEKDERENQMKFHFLILENNILKEKLGMKKERVYFNEKNLYRLKRPQIPFMSDKIKREYKLKGKEVLYLCYTIEGNKIAICYKTNDSPETKSDKIEEENLKGKFYLLFPSEYQEIEGNL